MQLGSPDLTQKCSTVSRPENPFILGQKVKCQGHKAQKVPAWAFALLRVLASSVVLVCVVTASSNDAMYVRV